jgi:NAD-dependent SIR2 family protein deacetylase
LTVNFPSWTNKLPALVAVGATTGLVIVVAIVWYYFSPKYTDVGYAPVQPIAFSHKLHPGLLGMDCRYCHTTVETAAHAAIPPSETCINCHGAVLPTSESLRPLRDVHDPKNAEFGNPIPWVKVHMLPQYAYFDHSRHLSAGIGCVSCHGRVDQMEIVRQQQPLSMSWCLECHREPELHLRPQSELFNMEYVHDLQWAREHKQKNNINPPTHCSACHR